MTTEYQQRIFALGKNLELFKKSANACDIQNMLDNSIGFVDTLRNANNMFESLPPQSRRAEIDTFHKSKEFVAQYFYTKGRINSICTCVLAKNRP